MLEQKLPAITSAIQGAYAGMANHVKNVVLQEMINHQRERRMKRIVLVQQISFSFLGHPNFVID